MKRQKSKSSHVVYPSSHNPKESRLFVRQQQIKRKLSKVHNQAQLEKIYSLMKSQNSQLANDITLLKLHLLQIEQNKKIQASTNKLRSQSAISSRLINESTTSSRIQSQSNISQYSTELTSQWQKFKKQLDQQYKFMNYIKNNIAILQKQTPTDQVNEEKSNRKNKITQLQIQIQKQKSKKMLFSKQCQKLQQSIELQQDNNNTNSGSIEQYEQENQQLRKRIFAFKQQTYKHESKAAQVIDSIYKNKQVITQYQSITKPSLLNQKLAVKQTQSNLDFLKRNKSVSNNIVEQSMKTYNDKNRYISAIASLSNSLSEVPNNLTNQKPDILTLQVNQLKQQVNIRSVTDMKAKQEFKKQKQLLKETAMKLNENFKELQRQKTKKISELNHLKAKIKNILKQIEFKQHLKVRIVHFGTQQTQINYALIKEPLRRDFAGIIGTRRSDDRMFLKQKRRTFIKGLIVYENQVNLSAKGSLVAVRAIYNDQQTNQANYVPLPGQYLHKCKTQRLQLPEDDFIKLIKVKYNTKQTRVTKIEVRSNRNLKYQFGDKRPFQQITPHETVYAFDIGLNELPVSLFSSYCQIRNYWYLESFGAEINTLL